MREFVDKNSRKSIPDQQRGQQVPSYTTTTDNPASSELIRMR